MLIVEDHDAPVGTVTHWAAYDIDPTAGNLSEGETGLRQGANDMGHVRYDGPKPPKGHGPHRYHFRLSALDAARLHLDGNPTHNEIKKAARSHVLGEVELIGLFETT